ncbi:MAG TPA: insulinase family protein, partial [Candidatus Obscuribacterales bacterium]
MSLVCQYAVGPAFADSAPQTVPDRVPGGIYAAPTGSSVSEQILPNGLKLVLLEDHSYPVVSCLTWYRVGARNETVGCTGITHLLEHMLFGSVGSFRRGEIASSIARVGGQFNGYTSDDFTTFFETLPAGKLELALKIESERMRKGVFSNKDLQEEIANIQTEFENESADASATLAREVRAMLYLTHPYHNPTMGWRNDVENLTAQQLKDYYDRYFWPDNCTMVISGDIQPAAALAMATKYFNAVPRAPHAVPVLKITEPPQRGERRIVVKYPGRQEALQVAYHGPAFDDPDAPAMEVLQKLLNAQYAGRLRCRLVDQKICTSASASFEAKKDPGYFAVTCSPAGGLANAQQKICEALDVIIGQLRTQPVTDVELRRARNLAEFAFYSEQEGPYRAGFHLGYFDVLASWQNAATWGERLRSVSAADVQRVAKRYLNNDNRVVAWLTGAGVPHITPPKPDPPAKPTGPHPLEHSRLTGYKTDDNALAPKHAADSRSNGDAVQRAIQDIPKALPAAVKDFPAAIGGAPAAIKELPTAVEKVPNVIKSLPSAVSGLPGVIKELPSAVGSVPSAIKQLPAAVGGLPGAAASAVKELPAAIVGLPGTAASTLKELPGTITAIPGAAASALKAMPSALGSFVVQVGSLPVSIAKPGSRLNAMPVFHKTLKNGVNVVVFPSHLAPIVQVNGALHAGDAYDPAGKTGLSQLVTTILSNGTSKRSRMQILTQQEDAGLVPAEMLHFRATEDSVRFSTRSLARDLPAQLDLIAESLMSPAAADADIDKARQDVLTAYKQAEDSGQEKAGRALLRSLLASSSPFLPQEPREVIRNVPNLTAADAHKFLSEHVVPSATTIVIAGDVDPDQ